MDTSFIPLFYNNSVVRKEGSDAKQLPEKKACFIIAREKQHHRISYEVYGGPTIKI